MSEILKNAVSGRWCSDSNPLSRLDFQIGLPIY